MRKSSDIRTARKAAEKRKYDALLPGAFDRVERADRREQRDQATQVRRNARNRL